MATTYSAAVDAMFALALSVLTGFAAGELGYAPDVRFAGVPKSNPPDKTKLWARITSEVITDRQASLANANGVSIFEASGLLFVQIFCPRNVGGSLPIGRLIGAQLQNAFRNNGSSGEIWYTAAKLKELPEDSSSYPILFSTRFYYKTLTNAA